MDEEEINQFKKNVRKSIQTLRVDQCVQQNLDLFEELLY